MINFADNFSLSSLLAFAGLAGIILANRDKLKFYNSNYWSVFVASLYIFGTLGILIYGLQGAFFQIISTETADYWGKIGYLFVLFGTVLFSLIIMIEFIRSIPFVPYLQIRLNFIIRTIKKLVLMWPH